MERNPSPAKSTCRASSLLLGALLTATCLTGCYTNYPAIGGTSRIITSNNPNDVGPERCMIAAVRWVMVKYPPKTVRGLTPAGMAQPGPTIDVALNLPAGIRKSYYQRIAAGIGPNVHPLTQEIWDSKSVPIYHVSRVWVREHQAKVDVLRPMPELGVRADGSPIYQLVEVTLTGPLVWTVDLGRSRGEPGLSPTPEPWFMPATDNPNEYRQWVRAQEPEPIVPPPATPPARPTQQVTAPEPAPMEATVMPAAIDPTPAPEPTPSPAREPGELVPVPPQSPPSEPKPEPK